MCEIIFDDLPKGNGTYRVVCSYGNFVRPYNWTFSVERQIEKKRLFRKSKLVWEKIDTRWCEEQLETRERLRKYAIKAFEDVVITPKELIKRALNVICHSE